MGWGLCVCVCVLRRELWPTFASWLCSSCLVVSCRVSLRTRIQDRLHVFSDSDSDSDSVTAAGKRDENLTRRERSRSWTGLHACMQCTLLTLTGAVLRRAVLYSTLYRTYIVLPFRLGSSIAADACMHAQPIHCVSAPTSCYVRPLASRGACVPCEGRRHVRLCCFGEGWEVGGYWSVFFYHRCFVLFCLAFVWCANGSVYTLVRLGVAGCYTWMCGGEGMFLMWCEQMGPD